MERQPILFTLTLLVLMALTGCSSVQRINPLSQAHGLPTQFESDEE